MSKATKGWQPIASAPRDGRPVWARGWDWGVPNTSHHYGWVYWDGTRWTEAGSEGSWAQHLVEWLPDTTEEPTDE